MMGQSPNQSLRGRVSFWRMAIHFMQLRLPLLSLALPALMAAALAGCQVMEAPRHLNEEEEATYHLLYAETMFAKCGLDQSYRVKLNDLLGIAIAAGDVLAPVASLPKIEKHVDANIGRAMQNKKWACAELSAWLTVTHSEAIKRPSSE